MVKKILVFIFLFMLIPMGYVKADELNLAENAKSAIIIEIASSNGCNCPISLFPINLITINTNMYNIIALKKIINIFSPQTLFTLKI